MRLSQWRRCEYQRKRKRGPRCHLSHEFIKWVSCSVGVALRRPEITARDLLPIGLILVCPPLAHVVTLPETRKMERIMASGHFLRASVQPSRDCGGMPRVIGRERTNPLSRTKARMVRGFMPTSTATRAIRTTRLIGTVAQARLSAGSRWMRNG